MQKGAIGKDRITDPAYGAYEIRDSNPKLRILDRIAKALGDETGAS